MGSDHLVLSGGGSLGNLDDDVSVKLGAHPRGEISFSGGMAVGPRRLSDLEPADPLVVRCIGSPVSLSVWVLFESFRWKHDHEMYDLIEIFIVFA